MLLRFSCFAPELLGLRPFLPSGLGSLVHVYAITAAQKRLFVLLTVRPGLWQLHGSLTTWAEHRRRNSYQQEWDFLKSYLRRSSRRPGQERTGRMGLRLAGVHK